MNNDFFRTLLTPKKTGSSRLRRISLQHPQYRANIRESQPPSLPLKIGTFSLLYLAVLAAISYANYMGPEDWWWSCLNAYLPQWAWAAPGLILLPIALWKARRVAFMSVLGLLWVFGPLMGLCWNFHPPHASNYPGGIPIRILTYNVNHHSDSEGVLEEIERNHPDIILLQEANERVDGA
jgi:endonuclease/exonuclease/phosphatase (EEP) superfamily protein YafD